MIDKMRGLIRRNTLEGFTLIETLVAVLMLTLSLAGPLSIASKGITATVVAKDQFIAFYLAQDAIEQIRFLRDSACLASAGDSTGCPSAVWTQNLTPCLTTTNPNGCMLDSLGNNPSAPAACATVCDPLRYDPTNRVFNYNTAMTITPQRFIRTIKIAPGSIADEVVVTVTVSWSDIAGVTRVPVTVRENLLRWQ